MLIHFGFCRLLDDSLNLDGISNDREITEFFRVIRVIRGSRPYSLSYSLKWSECFLCPSGMAGSS